MKHAAALFLGVVTLTGGSAGAGILNATDVFTSDPAGAWSYSERLNAMKGQSISYFVTNPADFQSATFQGYVVPDPSLLPGAWQGNGFDSIQLFETFAVSNVAQTVPVRLGGDDGHSLFIDDTLVGGGGFGVPVNHSLVFQANVPVKIQLVGYNGPGGWAFGFGEALASAAQGIDRAIDDIPGITIHATGNFSAVPEPSSLALFGIGVAGLVHARRRRKDR